MLYLIDVIFVHIFIQKYNKIIKKDKSNVEYEKSELEKFLFYFDRYQNNIKAEKLAKLSLVKLEETAKKLHEVVYYDFDDLQFLTNCGK